MSASLVRRGRVVASILLALAAFIPTLGAGARPALALGDVGASNVFTLPLPLVARWYASSSGDTVVWEQTDSIWGYDCTTSQLFQVPTSPGTYPGLAKISGRWIVYQAYQANDMDNHWIEPRVYCYDRATDTTFAVAPGATEQGNCAISGDTVVWESPNQSDVSRIYGKNLSTGATFTVSAAPGGQCQADIAGDWVVYLDGLSIRAYNIPAQTTKTLCTAPLCALNSPRISTNGFVVWAKVSDPRNNADTTSDLYGCNVNDGVIRKIAGGRLSQRMPSIGGNLIVYHDAAKPDGYTLVGYDLLSGVRFGISKQVAWYYYIAGIEDGTIARLYTDYSRDDYVTEVQLVCPTQLEVISDATAVSEAVDVGDDGLTGSPTLKPSSFARVAALAPLSNVSTVVVAAASDWQGSALACVLAGRQSPVLLTNTASVPASVLAKLADLAPQHVVVVGGTSSVSAYAYGQIQSVVGTDAVSREAGGDSKTRSLEIAKTVGGRPGWDGTVILAATGSSSSTLMAVPASVWKGLPMVLVDSKGLSTAQIRQLVSAGAKRFVAVGPSIPASTLSRVRSIVGSTKVKTILGTSISSTSAKFADWAVSSCGMSWNGVCLASVSNWSHTPMASLTQGRSGSVLLMSDPKSLSSSAKAELVTHHRSIRKMSFAGKSVIMSSTVRGQVRLAIK